MGYYTRYDLKVDSQDEKLWEFLENDETASNYGSLISFVNGQSDSCKWYDHEEEMKDVSKKFPDVLFTLEGEGEESDDIWKKYFKNGKMQSCYAKITFDEYDESKLE